MMKVVSGVDDAGKIVRRFDAPAGFARNQYSVHSPIPRYAVSSRAAAWPARLAPIVEGARSSGFRHPVRAGATAPGDRVSYENRCTTR
ncbi:Uncharacterised protein [Mycobacteroides abscessus subsp. abscessus]|nr:Uncharacterised protein [Mycobacteroides abscessus subsp. abscessus]